MDSLTQIVLGGAVGEAALGRKAGNKAVVWGAVAGTIPDLDVIAASFLDPVAQADFHRGVSHSLVFSLLVAPALGWTIARIHRKEGISARSWTWLAFLGLVTHPLLDMFTTWGTEFLWPFSPEKFAFNSVFVVDPAYTLPFLICLIGAMCLRRDRPRRRWINWVGIAWSCLYLGFGLVQKARARSVFEAEFARQGIEPTAYMTRPSPFNTFLWGTVAAENGGFWLGFHSLAGGSDSVRYVFYEGENLPAHLRKHPKIEQLDYITKGYWLARPREGGWLLSDLRYMTNDFQLAGDEDFIFNYFIREEEEGKLEVKLERKAPPMNAETWSQFRAALGGDL